MVEIIFGKNPIKEVLNSNRHVYRLLIVKYLRGSYVEEIKTLAEKRNIPVERVDQSELYQLLHHNKHQGVMAQVEPFQYQKIENILSIAERRSENPIIVFLDRIEDPHNFGAIIRSAETAGIHGIIIPKDHAVQVTPIVEKTSVGATAYVPIVRVSNLVQTIRSLKKRGFWFYGISQGGDLELDKVDFKGPIGIVLGSEGRGIRRLVQEQCDFLVRIPMYGKINSLNVSVAAGVVFFEIRKKLREK